MPIKSSVEKRARILQCLVEGNSVASTCRITGTAKNTVLKFITEAGEACDAYQRRHLVDLPCRTLQVDEMWSFVGCREKNKDRAKGKHPGEVWIWTAICADTKLIPSWHVGTRDFRAARAFCRDLASRVKPGVQITSDGLHAYRTAIGSTFKEVHYAQLVKIYERGSKGLDTVKSVEKKPLIGKPEPGKISTSYVERANLTVRMSNRRCTRYTNGFSKKIENHAHTMALMFMHYNFAKVHMTLKRTPAMAAGLSSRVWTAEDIVRMIDAFFVEKIEQQFETAFARITKASTPEPPKRLKPRYDNLRLPRPTWTRKLAREGKTGDALFKPFELP